MNNDQETQQVEENTEAQASAPANSSEVNGNHPQSEEPTKETEASEGEGVAKPATTEESTESKDDANTTEEAAA